MNDQRREILIGYLLGALEPQESAKVDAEMQINEDLRNDMAVIYQEISPIHEIADHYEPPVGLATRTCQNLWARIDSAENTQTAHALQPSKPVHKKRKITVIASQSDHIQEESTRLEPQELNSDTTLPLSQALLLAPQNPAGKPNKIHRRIDQPESTPAEPHMLLVDSMVIVKKHPPKHYGRKNNDTEAKIKRPWTLRDVVASLLVGLTAAVVVFPLIRIGISNFREMIIQQKMQNVANSMAPSMSQNSLYGLSQNDVRAFSTVTIDSQTATTLHNQRQNTPDPFADLQNPSSPPILPVNLPSGGDAP